MSTECHIVREAFDYISRDQEALDIVGHMSDRQSARKIKSFDKTDNPLISIPGSPGIGKSTFLNHFPETNAYKDYVGLGRSPIVSTLTFNSGMPQLMNGEDALGLRMIYRAAMAMGLMKLDFVSFIDYTMEYFFTNLVSRLHCQKFGKCLVLGDLYFWLSMRSARLGVA